MAHICHATGCRVSVPPEMWGCKRHWFMVPVAVRNRIWATYRPGQCDDMRPSREYCLAARMAVEAVALKEDLKPDTTLYDVFLGKHG